MQSSERARAGTKAAAVLFILTDLLLLVVLGVLMARADFSGSAAQQAAEIERGREYIETLEARDTEFIMSQVQTIRTQAMLAELEAEVTVEQDDEGASVMDITVDPETVWERFEDYAILGDSRAVGFSYYGFLPENRVFADLGATILVMEDWGAQAAQLNPSYVFTAFGVNDIITDIWTTAEDYAEAYGEHIDALHEMMPNAKLFVMSTLPTQEFTFSSHYQFANIPEYNEALQAMCEERDYAYFIDNSQVVEEHSDLYEGDGIHLNHAFYKYWAANMIEAVYKTEFAVG